MIQQLQQQFVITKTLLNSLAMILKKQNLSPQIAINIMEPPAGQADEDFMSPRGEAFHDVIKPDLNTAQGVGGWRYEH